MDFVQISIGEKQKEMLQCGFPLVKKQGNRLLRTPLQKCSLTADDGAWPPLEWCTHSAKMVHGGRGRGAAGRHA